MELVLDGNYTKVILEFDSIEGIYLVSSPCDPSHPYREVIGYIGHGVAIHGNIKFAFVPIGFNLVVD